MISDKCTRVLWTCLSKDRSILAIVWFRLKSKVYAIHFFLIFVYAYLFAYMLRKLADLSLLHVMLHVTWKKEIKVDI